MANTAVDDENCLKRQLNKANRRLLIGYCFILAGTVMFIVRIASLTNSSDNDTTYWVVFGIGLAVKVVGWILVIPARRQRYLLTQKLIARRTTRTVLVPNPPPNPIFVTNPPPPSYSQPIQYEYRHPTAPPMSQPGYNEPPPAYSSVCS